jgi:hypothetical protein
VGVRNVVDAIATLQARGIVGARHERTLVPVALQVLVRRGRVRDGALYYLE